MNPQSPSGKIVVIGGSAGALSPLKQIVGQLPLDIHASIFVVLHIPPDTPSFLAEILARQHGPQVKVARNNCAIEDSTIYVAQPDRHLQIAKGRMRVRRGPRENRSRPAIDPLFRSAARSYGDRVIAVLLSGFLDDGVAGLQSVAAGGGTAIVLRPEDTAYPEMPQNAIRYDSPKYILPSQDIASTIQHLTMIEKNPTASPYSKELEHRPSGYICPDCGGCLFEVGSESLEEFRCRVGHAYSLRALLAAEDDALESALWAAVRSLEENAELKRNAARRHRGETHLSTRLAEDADEETRHAGLLRKIVMQLPPDVAHEQD